MSESRPRNSAGSEPREAGYFATTHWTVVLAAREGSGLEATEALEKLCRAYWYPLYGYARRRGYSPHDAQDLTQEFFSKFLEKNYLGSVARERGKFRSFLLASMNHFLANEWDKARTMKRGGRVTFVSIDELQGEERYSREPLSSFSAERFFEQCWAEALLGNTLSLLRQEFVSARKMALFDSLKGFLTGEEAKPYAELAGELRMSQGALKMTVQRLKARYRQLLRNQIAQTVSSPEEVEAELKALLAALS